MTGAAAARKSTQDPIEVAQPSELENQVSRIFRASPERVFQLFTDRATLPYVMAPDPAAVTVERFDLRRGGRFSVAIAGHDGKTVRITGEFLEVDPPHRVVNTFRIDGQPGISAVETDLFEPVGEFTRLTVRWKFERREERDAMWGPESEAAHTIMWDHVAELLEQAVSPAIREDARAKEGP